MKKEMNYNVVDRFFEAFNMSRCKTAMLLISILVVIGFVMSVLLQIPREGLQEITILIIGYWIGKAVKTKDRNMDFDEYQLVKLIKRIADEDKQSK